ncbi:MAG: S41 family peptidase [Treponema sp.]|nr:S41 family peptidase [Treponema sp.]
MCKKVYFILFLIPIIFISCTKKKAIDISPIINDCVKLEEYLTNASIDVSLSIDNGLDIDLIISEIKNAYSTQYAPLNIKNNIETADNNGIYREAFATSIAEVLRYYLPQKNTHNIIGSGNKFLNTAYRKFCFVSNIYFEFRDGNYYVTDSNIDEIKKGMKYTGNLSNIIKTITEEKITYRFAYFNEFQTSAASIEIEGNTYQVPVEHIPFYSDKKDIISYEQNNNCIFVTINSCMTHSDSEKKHFEDTVNEISDLIDDSSNIVFDLRNNEGGYIEMLYPILFKLVLGSEKSKVEELCLTIDDFLNIGEKYLNTEEIRNMYSMWDTIDFLLDKKEDRYAVYEGKRNSQNIPESSYTGKILILQSTSTSSAAELFIAIMEYFFKDQVITIGQKTAGMLDFSGVLNYLLPDSRISLQLSSVDMRTLSVLKDNSNWNGDTEGFYPDFWCFSNEIDFLDYIMS